MGRQSSRGEKSFRSAEPQDPLKQKFHFQELSPDIQMVVLQGLKFRLARETRGNDLGFFDLDDLLDEEADDIINRYNWSRTIQEWLQFAETGK